MRFLSNLFGGKDKQNYKQLIKDGAIIVDVRNPFEFAAGHIAGSVNIPLNLIRDQASELKSRNKTIITCCRSGNSSAVAKSILKSMGLNVVNGGAWTSLNHLIH